MNNLKQLETREVTVGENIFYIRPLPANWQRSFCRSYLALHRCCLTWIRKRRVTVCSTSR